MSAPDWVRVRARFHELVDRPRDEQDARPAIGGENTRLIMSSGWGYERQNDIDIHIDADIDIEARP